MRTNLPKLLVLLICCRHSLNFSLYFFIMNFFCNKAAKYWWNLNFILVETKLHHFSKFLLPDIKYYDRFLQAWHKNPGERPTFQMTVEMLNSAWKSESVQEIARVQGVQPAVSSTYRVSNQLLFCPRQI